MAISQNSKITWTDIRALFDRVNAERNRFGYTPDEPLNLQNQKAEASIPNRLNTLISDMKSNSFIVNGTSINNVASFTVRSGDRISFTSVERMSELLSEIENIHPRETVGTAEFCNAFGFCNPYGSGNNGFSFLNGFKDFNGNYGTGYSDFQTCNRFYGNHSGLQLSSSSNLCSVFGFSGAGGNGGACFSFRAASGTSVRTTGCLGHRSSCGLFTGFSGFYLGGNFSFCSSFTTATGTFFSTHCNSGFGFCTSGFCFSGFTVRQTNCNAYGTSGTYHNNFTTGFFCDQYGDGFKCTNNYLTGFSGFYSDFCVSGFCNSFYGASYFNGL